MKHAVLLLALLANLGLFAAAMNLKADRPKAVVIFYTDDLGYNDTSVYGSKLIPSPNLEKLAAVIGYEVPAGSMRDSQDMTAALLGRSAKGRDEIIEESGWGAAKGFRSGNWKYISTAEPQLYDLSTDLAEAKNLAKEKPELVKKLAARLQELMAP